MRAVCSGVFFGLILGLVGQVSAEASQAKLGSYALKSGESTEISDLYWVINCRSQLTAAPEVTIMEGPPGVTAIVTEASVMPRKQACARPVKGGKLTLKADHIEDQSESDVTLRIKYPTKDGNREVSMVFSLSLFP